MNRRGISHVEILAIGAHPDDIELGCGGLLIKAARHGHSVYMYTLTRGDASGDPEQRAREANDSARFIGAKRLWLDTLPDTGLKDDAELIGHIESKIDTVHPDLILTHHSKDSHHDHRAVATATLEAGRFDSNILQYEIPLTRDFEPKVYFDISDVIDDKEELINLFKSQQKKLYLGSNAIRGLAEYRALQGRLNTSINYVEAFDAAKLCLSSDFTLRRVAYEKSAIGAKSKSSNLVVSPSIPETG
jgi:LmbE family N-acetylglucosaminyl deacetylase